MQSSQYSARLTTREISSLKHTHSTESEPGMKLEPGVKDGRHIGFASSSSVSTALVTARRAAMIADSVRKQATLAEEFCTLMLHKSVGSYIQCHSIPACIYIHVRMYLFEPIINRDLRAADTV